MKKQTKKILIGVAILISIVFIAMLSQGKFPFAVGNTPTPTFTPIFCNDYEFTCCNEIKNPSQPLVVSITDEIYYQCPSTATKCSIVSIISSKPLSIGGTRDWFVGSLNCRKTTTTLNGNYYECDNDVQHKLTMLPNDILFLRSLTYPTGANINGEAQIQVYDDRLDFTGRAGSTTGVPVSGADGCKFNPPGGKIYTSSSLANSLNIYSYTVPLGQCILAWQGQDRHICGYKEETCSSNSDCGSPVCTGRTKQTYGCKSYGNTISTTVQSGLLVKGDVISTAEAGGDVSNEQQSSSNTFGKRCEIVSAVTVQCCGDTDCGTNFFCNPSTNICEKNVECSSNSDCGVSVQCDAFAKKLKTPICSLGTCSFSEVSVDCCSDLNCQADSYCSAEKKCEIKNVEKTLCPNECCYNDERFFDKLCPDTKPYCEAGTCSAIPPKLKKCESCDAFVRSKSIGLLFPAQSCEAKGLLDLAIPQNNTTCVFSWLKLLAVPLAFILTLLFGINTANKFKKKNMRYTIFISTILISLLVGYLVYTLFFVGIILGIIFLVASILIKMFVPFR